MLGAPLKARSSATNSSPLQTKIPMQLIINAKDQVLAKYGNQLAALGDRKTRTAMSRALNHEGSNGRTQVKRALVKQTGIKYGAVDKATTTIRSMPTTLTYTLKARGEPAQCPPSWARADRADPGLAAGIRLDHAGAGARERHADRRPRAARGGQARGHHRGADVGDLDEAPEPPSDPISRPGDLWICGEHRVLCGTTVLADVERSWAASSPTWPLPIRPTT